MKRLPRPFIALIAALLLVLAQQGALAHMIGHGLGKGSGAAEASIKQGEDQHGAALSLSHVCTTCIAFAALGGFAPSAGLPPLPSAEGHDLPPAAAVAFAGQAPLASRARGPPSLL